MARSLLSQRLKQLEVVGIIAQRASKHGGEYHVTQTGKEIGPSFVYSASGDSNGIAPTSNLEALDVGRLMWAMRSTIRSEHFPCGRTTVQFDYADMPSNKRRWWVISEPSQVASVRSIRALKLTSTWRPQCKPWRE
jgi:hypothetical protein